MADKATTKHNLKILSLIRLKAECKIAPVRVDFEAPHRLLNPYSGPLSHQLPSSLPFTMTPPLSPLPSSYPPIRYITPNQEILRGECRLLETAIRRKNST